MALISLGLMAGKALMGGMSSRKAARPQIKQTRISSSTFRPQRQETQKIPKTFPVGGTGGVFGNPRGSLTYNPLLMPTGGASGGSLVETNKILIDIKSILVADYNERIQREQSELNAIRSSADKERRSAREGLLESGRKIGAATSGIFNKITAPLKGPLDGIIGFLNNVLLGFGMNVAFKWLSENKEKVDNAFNWLRDNFETVKNTTLGILGGALLLDIGLKLRGIYEFAKKLFPSKPQGGGGLPGKGGSAGGRQGQGNTGIRTTFNRATHGGLRSKLYDKLVPAGMKRAINLFQGGMRGNTPIPGLPAIGGPKPTGLAFRLGEMTGGFFRGVKGFFGKQIIKKARGLLAKLGPLRGLRSVLRLLGLVFLADEVIKDYKKGDIKAVIVKLAAYGLGWLATILINMAGVAIAGGTGGLGLGATVALAGVSMGAGAGVDYGVRKMFGYSGGGFVRNPYGGRSLPPGDNVTAALRVNEYVVNEKNSMRFPGVLDDINFNGGSLYMAMFRSLKEQKKNEDGYEKINEKFKKLLDDIEFKQIRGFTPLTPPSSSTTPPSRRPQLNPPPQNTSAGITPPSEEGTPGLMVVPPQLMGSTPPATPPPSSGKINNGPPNYEAEVPGLNPYINLVKMKYGLLGA